MGSTGRPSGTASSLSLALAVAVVAPGAPALAQNQAAAGTQLEEIVVTAQRREEKLQTVPITASAFGTQQLVEHHIETNTDLAKLVPALSTSLADRSDEQFTLRGQTGYGASFSGQQVAVPIYFGEVPLPIGDGNGPGRFFDLQNVQVLEGPQGTLFGRNSTGGAVLFTPKRPSYAFEGYGELQYGSYNDVAIEGAVNVPIVQDKLAVRFAGRYERRDGFTHDPLTGQDLDDLNYATGRVSILFTPTDTIENLTVFDIYHTDENGTSNHITNADPKNIVVSLYQGAIQAALAKQQAAGPRTTFGDVMGLDNIDALGVANTTSWDILPDLTFKNIFAYRHFEQLERYDYDGSPITLVDFDTCQTAATCHTSSPGSPNLVNVEQFTEEPQLQGKAFNDALNYTIGFFYLYDDAPGSNYQHATYAFGTLSDTNLFFHDDSYAGYAQFTYDVSQWIDGLRLTAGYRDTQDDRFVTISQVTNGACVTGATGTKAANPAVAQQCIAHFKSEENASTFTFGFDYQITPDAMFYFNDRRGYREGGVNPGAGTVLLANPPLPFAHSFFTYKPEYVVAFETGVKADWHFNDMSLRTNLDFYHSTLHDAQIYQTLQVAGTTPYGLTNAADAQIDGIELQSTFIPVKPLEIRGAYAYTDARFGPYLDYVNLNPRTREPTISSGRAFPFAPRHKLNLSARYQLPVDESLGDLSTTFTWTHESSVLLALVPFTQGGLRDPQAYQGPTDTFDLTVDWKNILKSGFDGTFYITNLSDTAYKIGGAALINSLGTDQAVYNEPRMIGIQLRRKFGPGS